MGLWENFALGFTYLSPVVGVYSTFALAFVAGGPPMIWSIVIAGIGQLLVALVFAEIVAQFPVAGGIYPWARRLIGRRWAWLTGWIYGWALIATVASRLHRRRRRSSARCSASRRPAFTTVFIAAALMLLCLLINLSGTQDARPRGDGRVRGRAHRRAGRRPVAAAVRAPPRLQRVLRRPRHAGRRQLPRARSWPASLLGLYLFYGFEACGDVAEEVPDPGATIPKAMRRTIYVGGAAALLITAALILAQPDFNAIISGENADPVGAVLQRRVRQRRLEDHHGHRADLVRVLRPQPAGRGEPADLLLRARQDGVRERRAVDASTAARDVPPIALAVACLLPAVHRRDRRGDQRIALLKVITLRLRGHLHRVPDGRPGGADRPQPRLGPERQVHARPLRASP